MTNPELNRESSGENSDHYVLKNPTTLELILYIKGLKDKPTSTITIVGKNSRGTFFDIIDWKKGSKKLKKLEKVNPLAKFPGEIIIHQN